jgi:hypothetical protein
VNITDPLNPVVTLALPADETNVWGFEIRDQDNTTVLFSSFYGQANFGAGYDMTYTYANNTNRTRTFYLYTYNLLGEYSAPFALAMVIPSPKISNVIFNDATLSVSWDSVGATKFEVLVQLVSGTLRPPGLTTPPTLAGASSYSSQVFSIGTGGVVKKPGTTTDTFYTVAETATLRSSDFFNERFVTIIPFDNMGPADGLIIDHVYAPPPVPQLDATKIVLVPPPLNPSRNPALPADQSFAAEFVSESWRNYQHNLGIAPQSD